MTAPSIELGTQGPARRPQRSARRGLDPESGLQLGWGEVASGHERSRMWAPGQGIRSP